MICYPMNSRAAWLYRLTTDGRGEYRIECRSAKDGNAPWQALISGFRDLDEARAALEQRRSYENADWQEVE